PSHRTPAQHAVEFITAPDKRAEVDAAARRIRALLQDGNLRLRDVVVLTRDLDDYHDLIVAGFGEHDLPFFADRRRTAAHHPLLQITRALLAVARRVWPTDGLMTLAKSGLTGIALSDADELENYILEHRIRGHMWASDRPWTFLRHRAGDEDPGADAVQQRRARRVEHVDGLRRKLIDPLRPFVLKLRGNVAVPLREIVRDLFALYDEYGVRQTLAGWMLDATAADRHELRAEHEQVWVELVELFDQMVDLLGDTAVTASEFQDVLDSGLERFDLALAPPTVDQVLVGQADRTRTHEAKAVVVLGLNDGRFPRSSRQDSIFSDTDRAALRGRALELEPDTARRMLDESLWGYVAITRASQRLIVTCSASDESGRPTEPSPYWRRLRELFPEAPICAAPREGSNALADIATPRQFVHALIGWVRRRGQSEAAPTPDDASMAALYQWLATHECCDDAVDIMRYRAWRALSYTNDSVLSPEVASKLFPSPLRATPSQLETFATCPFKHFLRYGLALRERQAEDVTAADLGEVFHRVLGQLVGDMLRQRQDWSQLAPEMTEQRLRRYTEEVGRSLRGELMLKDARSKYLLGRIERTLNQLVATQRVLAARGRFRPLKEKVRFGCDDDASLAPLTIRTPGGRQVVLHGQIDRVDLLEESAQVAVTDYKLTGNTLALDHVYHGISLQLLTYLLVLEANGQALAGKPVTAAAAFYLQMLRRLEDVKHPDDAKPPDDPLFDLGPKPRGIFDEGVVGALDTELEPGWSKVVSVRVNKEGECVDRGKSDVAAPEEFAALLAHVRRQIGVIADGIAGGDVSISPYRIGRQTPCPTCDYRSVCRFEAGVNRYHHLPPIGRQDVLTRVVESKGEARGE
ncbi:MAG: PD-(D/E)XK nuclease family protein, partial [Tepidisphaeraceae bacterium]